MAKELQTIQRKFIEQNVSLGGSNAYSTMQNAFNGLSGFGTKLATETAIAQATEQGSKQAIAKEGIPQKLAPGLTAATKAYNNAYNNTTTDLIGIRANSLIQENFRNILNSPNFGSNSLGQFTAINGATIEGILSKTPDHLKADVSLQLLKYTEMASNKMADNVETFNRKKISDDFDMIMGSKMNSITEAIYSGDINAAKAARTEALEAIQNQKSLMQISPTQELALIENVNSAIIDGQLKAGYLNSIAAGNEDEYLYNLAAKKPEGMSVDQWFKANSAVLGVKSQQGKLRAEHNARITAEVNTGIADGSIKELTDLDQYQNKVPASQFAKMSTSVLKSQIKSGKTQAAINEYQDLKISSPTEAVRMSDATKNAAYDQEIQVLLDEKKRQTGNPNTKLSLLDQVPIMVEQPGPIQIVNDKLNASVLSEDLNSSFDAIMTYDALKRANSLDGAPILNMDKKSEQIAVVALNAIKNAREAPEIAIPKAQKSVLLSTDSQREARLASYKANYVEGKTGKKASAALFEDIFGASAADNNFAFKTMQDTMRINSEEMPTLQDAAMMTKAQLQPNWGTSKYAKDKNAIMKAPPEKVVAYSTQGNWFENQLYLNVYKLAKTYERIPELQKNLETNRAQQISLETQLQKESLTDLQRMQLQAKLKTTIQDIRLGENISVNNIRWGGKPLPTNVSEEDLDAEPLSRTGQRQRLPKNAKNEGLTEIGLKIFSEDSKPYLIVNGKKKQVFLESDPSTLNRTSGKTTYGLYYNDDFGRAVPIQDPMNERTGLAEFSVKERAEMLPRLTKEMDEKTIDQLSEKQLEAIFGLNNPGGMLQFLGDKGIVRNIQQRREFIKKNKDKTVAELKKLQGDTNATE